MDDSVLQPEVQNIGNPCDPEILNRPEVMFPTLTVQRQGCIEFEDRVFLLQPRCCTSEKFHYPR